MGSRAVEQPRERPSRALRSAPGPLVGWRRRRRRDAAIAAVLGLLVLATAFVVHRTSTAHRAELDEGGSQALPTTSTRAPRALAPAWSATTDPTVGAAVSPAGVVALAANGGVRAVDVRTGEERWSYRRPDRGLCALSTADRDNRRYDVRGRFLRQGFDDTETDAVRGILVGFGGAGACQEFATFDPVTGGRVYSRTAAGATTGEVVQGGAYAGWATPSLVQLWRWDLVRTIEYGDQQDPTDPGGSVTGCRLGDALSAASRLAVVQHCDGGDGTGDAQIVVNHADPRSQDKTWNVFVHPPIATIETGSPDAVLVGLTDDRVAAVVGAGAPQLVVWDFAGRVRQRTAIPVDAAALASAGSGVLPRRTGEGLTTTWIDGTLVATRTESVREAPAATTAPSMTGASRTTSAPTSPGLVDQDTVTLAWTAPSRGLGAIVGSEVLLGDPRSGAITAVDAASGDRLREYPAIPGGSGRTDLTPSSAGRFVSVAGDGTVEAFSSG